MSNQYLLVKNFLNTVKSYSSKPAMMEKRAGSYCSITYQEMKEKVEQVAAFLLKQGLSPQSKLALLAENRPEWPITDMGAIMAGMVNVPIYTTLTPAQIRYILNDSDSQVLVLSKDIQLQKIAAIYHELPLLKFVVVMDDFMPIEMGDIRVMSFAQMLMEGKQALAENRPKLVDCIAQAQEEDLVSIVYTSGTTGDPKGVMLTNKNFAANSMAATEALNFDNTRTTLSFLPLSHVLERMVNYVVQFSGATVAYAESIDTVSQNLQEVHPNAFVGVPRVFEKIYNRIIDNVEAGKPLKKHIFYWALAVGKERSKYELANKPVPPLLSGKAVLADKLVFGKIRERTGGNLEFAISGGAPLMKEIAEFFFAIGLPIYEGYGLTETSPVLTCNRKGASRLGSVGQVIRDVTIKIAEDGEILAKGPNIMRGYYNKPDATAEVIDAEGWFHTGDIGEIDAEGFLKITDRKKEILVMSNGKNVAPQPIENALKNSPYIEQAVVLGNNEKYIAALIYPNFDLLLKFAREKGIANTEPAYLAQQEQVHTLLRQEIDKCTKDFARFEQIKKFHVMHAEMTQDSGHLTPSLKYKRKVINESYQSDILALFAEH